MYTFILNGTLILLNITPCGLLAVIERITIQVFITLFDCGGQEPIYIVHINIKVNAMYKFSLSIYVFLLTFSIKLKFNELHFKIISAYQFQADVIKYWI